MKKHIYRSAFKLCLLLVFLLSHRSAEAINGNDWLKLPEEMQTSYVSGVVDAFNQARNTCLDVAKEIANADCSFAKFLAYPLSCYASSPYTQVVAIVQKYMRDHPEKWHYTMASTVWVALSQTCKYNSQTAR